MSVIYDQFICEETQKHQPTAAHADSQACGAAILASLQALAEVGRHQPLESWMTQHLLQLRSEMQFKCCGGSLQKEVAYMDGTKAVSVPGPLRQHSNAQLQLWYASCSFLHKQCMQCTTVPGYRCIVHYASVSCLLLI